MKIYSAQLKGTTTVATGSNVSLTGSFTGSIYGFNDTVQYSSSVDSRIVVNTNRLNNIESKSASVDISISNINAVTSSFSPRVLNLESKSASVDISISNINAVTASNIARLSNLETKSASVDISISNINAVTASNIARLSNLETKSSSVDISITNINSFTASNGNTSLNQLTGSLATTGSNSFFGTQVFSGSVYIANDLIVQGSSSIQYISASSVSIGTNIVQLNTANPSVRFAGLTVIDSGSVGGSGSFLYDSLQDEFIFIHRGNGTNVTSSHFVTGPETYDSLGNETYLTCNVLTKGTGKEHLVDSCIFDNGTTTCIKNNLIGTGTISGTTIYGSTIACSPIGCFATSCATAFIGGTMSGTTIYGSTAVCAPTIQSANVCTDGSYASRVVAYGSNVGMFVNSTGAGEGFYRILNGACSIGALSATGWYKGSAEQNMGIITGPSKSFQIATNDCANSRLTIGADGVSVFACQVCSPSFIGGTMSGTTIYGSTAVCSAVGKFTSCIDAGSGTFSGNALTVSGNNPAITATTSDTTLYSYIALTGGTSSNYIYTLANSYNTTGPYVAGALTLVGTTSGGISIAAQCASGLIRFYTCEQERMRITSGGSLLIGSTTQAYNPQTQGYLLGVKSNTTQAFISIAKSGQTLDSGGMIVGLDTTTGYVLVQANIALSLATNDTERMRITSTGIACFACRVCTPSLTVSGDTSISGMVTLSTGNNTRLFTSTGATTGYQYMDMYNTAGRLVLGINGSSANAIASNSLAYGGVIYAQCSLQLGVDSDMKITIASTGVATFSGTVCAPCFATISDYRMKSNIRPIEGLSIIMNTKPYKFEYNYDCSTSFGMIAHELQDTLPEAVFGYKDGEVMQGVDYMKLLPIAIKAIQEQQCTINLLKTCIGIV